MNIVLVVTHLTSITGVYFNVILPQSLNQKSNLKKPSTYFFILFIFLLER